MDRTLSSLPISVGTGLAIESLVQTNLSKYSSILFNIRTIFRNALSAYIYDEKLPSIDSVAHAMEEDMIGIAEALNGVRYTTHLDLIFYQPSYKGIKSMFPLAKLKIVGESKTTKLQYEIEELRKKVTNRIIDRFEKIIIKNDVRMPDFNGNGLVMTHHPVDLATTMAYSRLKLIESHTGVIKPYSEFYTKLTNGSELMNIPLNKLTIQVFGDRATNFYSLPTKIKEEVKKLADEANWSSASTPSFCTRTIKGMSKGSPDREILLKLIN